MQAARAPGGTLTVLGQDLVVRRGLGNEDVHKRVRHLDRARTRGAAGHRGPATFFLLLTLNLLTPFKESV
jgi:hypothetical protein